MPAATKRAAGKAAGEPKAKAAKKEDPATLKLRKVTDMLELAEGLPAEVVKMLSFSAKTSLGVAKGERHEMQSNVVTMIGEVLASVLANKQGKADASQEVVATGASEKTKRASVAEAAEAAAKAKGEALEAANAAVEAAGKAVAEANKALKGAEKEQKEGDADLVKAEKAKTTLEGARDDELKHLKEGSSADATKQFKALAKVCNANGFETQLVLSSEAALLKAPDARGSFDNVVVTQLDEAFTAAIGKLTEQLSAGEAGKAERAAKVEAAKATAEAAKADETARGDEQTAAAKEAQEAQAALKAANKSVKELGPELQKAIAEASSDRRFLTFYKGVMREYKELAEGVPEPMEPTEAVAADATA